MTTKRPPIPTRPMSTTAVIVVTALTAIAPMVWGTTYVVTSELLPPGHPLFSGLVRALPAGLLAIALTRTLPTGSWWVKATILGVLNIGAFFPLLFLTAYRLPGGVAATLNSTQPLVVAVLAVVLLAQPLSRWRVGWGLIGLLGVCLIVLRNDAALDGAGIAAGVIAAASMGAGVTLTKRWGRPGNVGAMAFAGWQLTAGGLFLLPITLLIEGVPSTVTGPGLAGYAWLGLVGGLLTYTLWFWGIGRLPVTSVALLGLLSPVVAAVLGALLLGEVFGPAQMIGFILAMAAIVAGQFNGIRPAARPHEDPAPSPPSGLAADPALEVGAERSSESATPRKVLS